MEEHNIREEVEIDLKQIFFAVLDKFVIILMVGIIFGMAAFTYTKFFVEPVYKATSKVYIQQAKDNNDNSQLTSSQVAVASYLAQDYAKFIVDHEVMELVIDEMNLTMGPTALAGKISIYNPEDTRILEISVSDTNPEDAAQIADVVAKKAREYINNTIMNDVDIVTVYSSALTPTAPVSPNVKRNTLLAALLGMAIVVLIVVIRFIMDDTIKTAEDVERYLGISVLASIPLQESEAEHKKKKKKKKKKKVAKA
ncbi:MAG: YveK family protein [Eubacterium sp.]